MQDGIAVHRRRRQDGRRPHRAGADFTHLATFKSYVTGRDRRRRHPRPGHDEQAVRHARHRHAGADPDRVLQRGRRRRVPQGADGRRGMEVRRRSRSTPTSATSASRTSGIATRKPNFQKLVFQIVPDESSRVAGVKTGALDIAFGLTRLPRPRSSTATPSTRSSRPRNRRSPTAWRSTTSSPTRTRRSRTSTSARRCSWPSTARASPNRCTAASPRWPTARCPSVMLGYDDSVEPLPYDPDAAQDSCWRRPARRACP